MKAEQKCDHTVQRQTLKRKDIGHKMQEESEDSHKEHERQENSRSRKKESNWVVRMLKNGVWKEKSAARKATLESSNSDLSFSSEESGKKLHSKHTLCHLLHLGNYYCDQGLNLLPNEMLTLIIEQ